MLSMVGGALKKINGVKETNKLGSQNHTNKKDATVLQYNPTPIHILKAKSAGRGLQYDPVSNFSASSRVTLPSCTKRVHNVDAALPTKRSKVTVVDSDDIVEAVFSDDDDDEQITGRICGSGTVSAPNSKKSSKSNEDRSLQSLVSKQPVAKVPNSSKNNLLKTVSASVPVSATTAKSSAAQPEPRDSENCSSTSQAKLTFNSDCPESAKLQSTDDSGKQHSSHSEMLAIGVEKQHTDKVNNTSSGSKSAKTEKLSAETLAHSKKIKTSSHDGFASKHTSSHSHNKDHKSTHHKNSEQMQTANVGSSIHSGREIDASRHHHESTDHKNSDGRKTLKSKHHSSKDSVNHNCQSSDVISGKQSSRDGCSHDSTPSKSDQVKSTEKNGSIREHRHPDDKHKNHTHNHSKHSNKTVSAPNSHRDSQSETLSTETSACSKKSSSSSSFGKHTSPRSHTNEHKTSHHTKSKCKLSASSVRSIQEDGSHKESGKPQTVTTISGKEGKSSSHRHSKHKESASMTDGHCTRLEGRSHTESCSSKTVASNSPPLADMKRISALQNIELFGEDSDTESSLLQSPAPAQQTLCRSSVASHASQSSDDEVILLPTDDLSDDSSDNDDTFEQCQQLYNDLARQQQAKPNICTSNASHNVSYLMALLLLLPSVSS